MLIVNELEARDLLCQTSLLDSSKRATNGHIRRMILQKMQFALRTLLAAIVSCASVVPQLDLQRCFDVQWTRQMCFDLIRPRWLVVDPPLFRHLLSICHVITRLGLYICSQCASLGIFVPLLSDSTIRSVSLSSGSDTPFASRNIPALVRRFMERERMFACRRGRAPGPTCFRCRGIERWP